MEKQYGRKPSLITRLRSRTPNILLVVIGDMLDEDECTALGRCLGSSCVLPDMIYNRSVGTPHGSCKLVITNKEIFKKRISKFRIKYAKQIVIIDISEPIHKSRALFYILTMAGGVAGIVYLTQLVAEYINI